MAATWDEMAHKVLDVDGDPIKADATNLAKYGAPAVGVVAAVLAAVLGSAWNLDPSKPAVIIAAAVIVASVVLGIYFAFAWDIRSRGSVTTARFVAITGLAEQAGMQEAIAAQKKIDDAAASQKAAEAAQKAAEAKLTEALRERDVARARLEVARATDVDDSAAQIVMAIGRVLQPNSARETH